MKRNAASARIAGLMEARAYETLAILKADRFGTVSHCLLEGRPVIRRDWTAASGPIARRLAARLARREAHALARLAHLGDDRVPRPLYRDSRSSFRSYIEGRTLKDAAPPPGPAYYADALCLVGELHAAGIVHNDLEKPENWLVTPDGRPAIVDFQVALRFRNRGNWLFRLAAREDVRHVLKNKRRYCADPLTADERRTAERRGPLARLNAAVVKPIYRFVTRRLLGTSDRARSRHSR